MSYGSREHAPKTTTGSDGQFVFEDVPAGVLGLMGIHHPTHGQMTHWYRSIDFGNVAVHGQHQLLFSVDPEATCEGITITVEKRSRITGQVWYADGAPVANARLTARHAHYAAGGSGEGDERLQTDELGRFIMMVDKVARHILTITHERQVTESVDFTVSHPGEDIDGLEFVLADADATSGPPGWIENPANGHRYRPIEEGSWFECHQTAISMGAHIVTIADQAEQKWLLDTFGTDEPYWIGLTDEQVESTWRWVTGEPLEYTNWAEGEPNEGHAGGEDYAYMNGERATPGSGAWSDLGPASGDWYTVRKAIVETGAIGGR